MTLSTLACLLLAVKVSSFVSYLSHAYCVLGSGLGTRGETLSQSDKLPSSESLLPKETGCSSTASHTEEQGSGGAR